MSAGERQSLELMKKVKKHIKALKVACDIPAIRQVDEKVLTIEIPGILTVTAIPANPETARGFTGDVFLDEYAIQQHSWEIWAAMLPTITRSAGEIDIASTPKGKRNMFAKLRFNKHFHHDTVTIVDAVKDGLDANIDTLRSLCMDDEIWRQEYMCEFIDDASVLIPYEVIDLCEDSTVRCETSVQELAKLRRPLYLGIDVGRKHDLTVLWVISEVGTAEWRTEAVFELQNWSFAAQEALIGELLELRMMRKCKIDATGLGLDLSERLVWAFGAWKVEPVTFTLAAKHHLGFSLRRVMKSGQIAIPVSKNIREDLHSIEKVITDMGNMTLKAIGPTDGHADRFWAIALALDAANSACVGEIPMASSDTA